jgi:Domain of unknown function (DUF6916)
VDIEAVTAESMRPFIGQRFRVVAIAEHDVDLMLTEVDEPDSSDARVSSFALLFEGPVEIQLAQGTWQLNLENGDSVGLFLVPLGPTRDNDRMEYESSFSRLTA